MPAAAVIPAPIAYIKVVAVKKLVVEFQGPLVAAHCSLVDSVLAATGPFSAGKPALSARAGQVFFPALLL